MRTREKIRIVRRFRAGLSLYRLVIYYHDKFTAAEIEDALRWALENNELEMSEE